MTAIERMLTPLLTQTARELFNDIVPTEIRDGCWNCRHGYLEDTEIWGAPREHWNLFVSCKLIDPERHIGSFTGAESRCKKWIHNPIVIIHPPRTKKMMDNFMDYDDVKIDHRQKTIYDFMAKGVVQ